ncbi:MAG: FAD-dependent oxidoreductase [Varibaculum sp.]|nr:FAD-dependent oxidoreductase [Varibaculum sp.]
MAQIVILGAGISGHTAAMRLARDLRGSQHKIVVINPRTYWNWVPSNIWVGTGKMDAKKVTFELGPIYKRAGVDFRLGAATVIHPEGGDGHNLPFVEYAEGVGGTGATRSVEYDFLINCTGPKLKFEATPGLGPDTGNTVSVCTDQHAIGAAKAFKEVVQRLRAGQKQRLVIGTGSGTCTCQGAAFEYTYNVEHELREMGLRDKAEIVYLTNEAELGDFGVGGLTFKDRGYLMSSRQWAESLFRERGVKALTGTAPVNITKDEITYENIAGETHTIHYDFAMLLPPFVGVGMTAVDKNGEDITGKVFNPAGFLKVDGDYTPKKFEEFDAKDWPKTYQNPDYPNMFAAGIAFAPPHQITRPYTNPNGTAIAPAPPRTGMPSGTIAAQVAKSVADLLKNPHAKLHEASMAELGSACVASTGNNLFSGSAASILMYPIVPNPEKFGVTGRHPRHTKGEIGLGGHWTKLLYHYLFIYKAKARPLWWLLPE